VGILDLILDNWWILLGALWLLSGVLGKKGKEQERQKQNHNHNSRPDAHPVEVDGTRDDHSSIEFPWEKVEGKSAQASPQRNQSQRDYMESSVENVVDYRKGTQMMAQDVSAQDIKSVDKVRYSKEAKQILDFKNINKTTVVQGMVWSQIFGKPRSKEPHRASKYTRYGKRA
jgi:hypothetical protein